MIGSQEDIVVSECLFIICTSMLENKCSELEGSG